VHPPFRPTGALGREAFANPPQQGEAGPRGCFFALIEEAGCEDEPCRAGSANESCRRRFGVKRERDRQVAVRVDLCLQIGDHLFGGGSRKAGTGISRHALWDHRRNTAGEQHAPRERTSRAGNPRRAIGSFRSLENSALGTTVSATSRLMRVMRRDRSFIFFHP